MEVTISFTIHPLHSWGQTAGIHLLGGMYPRAELNEMGKKEILTITGIGLR
jgi:hypothetical protein